LSNQATHHSQHAANSHGVRRSHHPWIFSVFEKRLKRPVQTLPTSYAGPEDPALNECREARWAYEGALRWDLAADGHYPTPLSDMCSAFARLYGRRKPIHYFSKYSNTRSTARGRK